jgi:hypothetical protein
MSKYPMATKKRAEVVSPEAQRGELVELQPDSPRFFSFHYSYTEVSLQGGRTRVKHNETKLVDGRLSSESFDGELAPGVYQQMLAHWQRLALSWLLPFSRRSE